MKILHMFKTLSFVAVFGLLLVSVGQAQAQSRTIRVISVSAPFTTVGSDTDQIYFNLYKSPGNATDRIAGSRVRTIKKGGTLDLNQVFTLPEGLTGVLRLLEDDSFSGDDLIGEITISPRTPAGQQTKVWTGDFSNYVVVLDIK